MVGARRQHNNRTEAFLGEFGNPAEETGGPIAPRDRAEIYGIADSRDSAGRERG